MRPQANLIGALQKHWVCEECEFRIEAAPNEEEPRHCPMCYEKRDNVVELDKISAYEQK